jgi:gliding motility-associated-like protein
MYLQRFILFIALHLLMQVDVHAQDFPPNAANITNFTADSYIIPMDNGHQALNGEPFNLQAYGLLYELLEAGVEVHWAIRSGKAKDEIDFSVNCARVYPSAGAASNQDFRAGAYIIDGSTIGSIPNCGGSSNLFIDDLISDYGQAVAVYRAINAFSADVRYVLNSTPVIAILDDGGFSETGYQLLDYVDIPYTLISYSAFAQNNGCYTMIAQPHLSSNDVDASYAGIVTNFLNNGGNFFAQCSAVEAFEENANYLTTTGFTYFSQNLMSTGFLYENNDMPVMQFEGPVLGFGVGSVSNFALEGAWMPYAYPGVSGTNEDNVESFLVAAGDYNGTTIGGNVFYLGGHNYTPQEDIQSGGGGGGNTFTSDIIESYNLNRVFLNAAFVPASWATPCAAPNQCICPGQSVNIGCDFDLNIGYSWSPSTNLSCTNCPNPVATPATTTTYTVSSGNGCSSVSMTVFVDCPITNTITAVGDTICPNDCGYLLLTTDLIWAIASITVNGQVVAINDSLEVCASTTTTYTIVVTDNQGTTFTTDATLDVWELPVAVITGGTPCTGTTVAYNANNMTNPTWSSAAPLSCTICNTTDVDVSGDFTLIATDVSNEGCTYADTLNVMAIASPTPTVNNATICHGESVSLTASGAENYFWPSPGVVGPTITVQPNTTSNIMVVGTNQGVCSDTAYALVTVIPIQAVVIEEHVNICENDSCATLTTAAIADVAWYDTAGNFVSDQHTIQVCPDVETFYVAITTDQGCFLPDTVSVYLVPLPDVHTSNDTIVCPGEYVELSAYGAATYTWYHGATEIDPIDQMLQVFMPHELVVAGTDTAGCMSYDTLFIDTYPQPSAAFHTDPTDNFFAASPIYFINNSTDATCYSWGMGDGYYTSSESLAYSYDLPGFYVVELAACNDFGCYDTTKKGVNIQHEFHYYLPTAFTPNNQDHLNNVFKIEGMSISEENFELTIFNRWGEMIYRITSPSDVWLGNHYSNEHYFVPDGVYNWRLKLMDEYSKMKYEDQGHVVILR